MYAFDQVVVIVGCTAWLTSAIWLLAWSHIWRDRGDDWPRMLGRHEGRAEVVAAFAAYRDGQIGLCELVAEVPELRPTPDVILEAEHVAAAVWRD